MKCIAKQPSEMSISSREITSPVCVPMSDGEVNSLYEEVNMANNVQAFQRGEHPGYEETAWEGIKQTIDVIADKGIKVVINGGALNPKGLAFKVDELVCDFLFNLQ
jgi:hypothetical protein